MQTDFFSHWICFQWVFYRSRYVKFLPKPSIGISNKGIIHRWHASQRARLTVKWCSYSNEKCDSFVTTLVIRFRKEIDGNQSKVCADAIFRSVFGIFHKFYEKKIETRHKKKLSQIFFTNPLDERKKRWFNDGLLFMFFLVSSTRGNSFLARFEMVKSNFRRTRSRFCEHKSIVVNRYDEMKWNVTVKLNLFWVNLNLDEPI